MANSDLAAPRLQDVAYVQGLRRQMLQFAHAKLGDPHQAEDVVQEALMGALKNAEAFAERARFDTWVFGILKHKIADARRAQQRPVQAASQSLADLDETTLQSLLEAPASNPAHLAETEQLQRVLGGCMGDLSPQQSQAFALKNMADWPSAAIGQRQGIGLAHVHVLLHRAGAKLRHCLEHHWFGRR
jgi:RNA polymerase sigma-70 factor (TIGR02943 family)